MSSLARLSMQNGLGSFWWPDTHIYFLKGGYETFYLEHPECCMNVKLISKEKVKT